MSFFTCFCDFPQKEHLSRSPPSPIRATYVLLPLIGRLMPARVAQSDVLLATSAVRAGTFFWTCTVHRLPARITEAAGLTLPAGGRFSDPPKRACQGPVTLTQTTGPRQCSFSCRRRPSAGSSSG